MQCHVLNANYEAETVLDGWFSFIWTERFLKTSEFKIELPNTPYYQNLLPIGTILVISDSNRPQVVETIYEKRDNQGAKILVVEGRDLTSWMELRPAPFGTFYGSKKSSEIVMALMQAILVNGSSQDKLPRMTLAGTANDNSIFNYEVTKDDLLSNVLDAGNLNNIAVRCERVIANGTPGFVYRMYNGLKRDDVIFSEKDNTLMNTTAVRSKKNFKNIALIYYRDVNVSQDRTWTRWYYSPGTSASTSGLDRRVLTVDATNLNVNDYPGTDGIDRFGNILDQTAKMALGKANEINAVDGEVPSYVTAKYGTDYLLGDIVKFQSTATNKTDARVTEYIRIVDSSGYRQYPTVEPLVSQTV